MQLLQERAISETVMIRIRIDDTEPHNTNTPSRILIISGSRNSYKHTALYATQFGRDCSHRHCVSITASTEPQRASGPVLASAQSSLHT